MGSKLWEVVNFREFLEEKAGPDELFFFLHCRFLINRGEGGNSFGYTQFIRLDYTEVIIEIIFASFEEETRNFIKARLKDKSKIKNKALLIDVSFVLRVFLEYFRVRLFLLYNCALLSTFRWRKDKSFSSSEICFE